MLVRFKKVWQKASCEVFSELFVKSWWVWVFSITCFGVYEQASYFVAREITSLEQEITLTEKKLRDALVLQDELKLQLRSLSDPAWIEQVLIKNLGVIPQEYTKIYFQPTSNAS